MTTEQLKVMGDAELTTWLAENESNAATLDRQRDTEKRRADSLEQQLTDANERQQNMIETHRNMRSMCKANNDVVDWAILEARGLQNKVNNLVSRLEKQQAIAKGKEVPDAQ